MACCTRRRSWKEKKKRTDSLKQKSQMSFSAQCCPLNVSVSRPLNGWRNESKRPNGPRREITVKCFWSISVSAICPPCWSQFNSTEQLCLATIWTGLAGSRLIFHKHLQSPADRPVWSRPFYFQTTSSTPQQICCFNGSLGMIGLALLLVFHFLLNCILGLVCCPVKILVS